MQIDVRAAGIHVPDQCRVYAQYRLFSAVSRFGGNDTVVNVDLEECAEMPWGTPYCCIASVELTAKATFEVRAFAKSLYGAIDGAAERLSAAIELSLAEGDHGEVESPEAAPEGAFR